MGWVIRNLCLNRKNNETVRCCGHFTLEIFLPGVEKKTFQEQPEYVPIFLNFGTNPVLCQI
jgi:hypothetical protein